MLCAVLLMCGSARLSDPTDTMFNPKFNLLHLTLFFSVQYYYPKQHRVFGKLKQINFCIRI